MRPAAGSPCGNVGRITVVSHGEPRLCALDPSVARKARSSRAGPGTPTGARAGPGTASAERPHGSERSLAQPADGTVDAVDALLIVAPEPFPVLAPDLLQL